MGESMENNNISIIIEYFQSGYKVDYKLFASEVDNITSDNELKMSFEKVLKIYEDVTDQYCSLI